LKKLILFCLASVFVLACGDDDSDNNPINNVREAVEDRDLQNRNFESACTLEPIDAVLTGVMTGGSAAVKSARVQYLFKGSNITRTTLLYADANCGDHALTFRERGSFDVNPDKKSNDGGKHIDINYESLHLEVKTEAGKTVANDIKLCGADNWEVEKEREVTEFSADLTCYGMEVPRHVVNIYRVDDNTLYFGAAVTDASDRPAKLNFKNKYIAE
jgi:hypothetical protein